MAELQRAGERKQPGDGHGDAIGQTHPGIADVLQLGIDTLRGRRKEDEKREGGREQTSGEAEDRPDRDDGIPSVVVAAQLSAKAEVRNSKNRAREPEQQRRHEQPQKQRDRPEPLGRAHQEPEHRPHGQRTGEHVAMPFARAFRGDGRSDSRCTDRSPHPTPVRPRCRCPRVCPAVP